MRFLLTTPYLCPMPNPFFAKAARYCASRERCRTEVLKKLRDWGDPHPHNTLSQLQNDDYQNEQRFASAFVHDKFYLESWGPHKIKAALHNKQVDSSLIAAALQRIRPQDHDQCLKRLSQKKFLTLKTEQQKDPLPYLARFLQQRGFETGLLFQYWNDWRNELNNEENQ